MRFASYSSFVSCTATLAAASVPAASLASSSPCSSSTIAACSARGSACCRHSRRCRHKSSSLLISKLDLLQACFLSSKLTQLQLQPIRRRPIPRHSKPPATARPTS